MSAHGLALRVVAEIGNGWTAVPGRRVDLCADVSARCNATSEPKIRKGSICQTLFFRQRLNSPLFFPMEVFCLRSLAGQPHAGLAWSQSIFQKESAFLETLPVLSAARYMVPLREGGSLPAILEMEGGELYVAKFRGAGQGAKALTAEVIVGELARRLGLPVPDIAVIDLDESFGRSEPDPEIQDVLKGSRGMNVGLRFIEGAYTFDPVAFPEISPDLAAEIVWLDAFVLNVDRTPRNTNILLHDRNIWLIDHGAALYFHHNWEGADPRAKFPAIRDHALLPLASSITEADRRMSSLLDSDLLADLLALVPDTLLMDAPAGTVPSFASADENRAAYVDFLTTRLASAQIFVGQAEEMRGKALQERPIRKEYRR